MSSSDPKARPKPGPWPPVPESSPMPPSSWAKITGFRPKFSGETNASDSGQISTPPQPREPDNQPDLEVDQARAQPQPAAARAEPTVNGQAQGDKLPLPAPPATDKDQPTKRRRDSDGAVPKSSSPRANRRALDWPAEAPRRPSRSEEVADVLPQTADDDGFASRHSRMKYELRDNPGLVPISFFYGFQYFLSMLGSLVLVPLVIVPAMGGDHDIAAVVSTVLLVSGVTTFLQTCFGSRSPLIQDPSFVYLAPALAIINSPEFQGLNGNNFKQIMRELQGAIIVTSAFQAILGYSGLYFLAKSYSGLMSILLSVFVRYQFLVIIFF